VKISTIVSKLLPDQVYTLAHETLGPA
jgi:hypothetical protein